MNRGKQTWKGKKLLVLNFSAYFFFAVIGRSGVGAGKYVDSWLITFPCGQFLAIDEDTVLVIKDAMVI